MTSPRPTSADAQGFTLLEMLLALAILSLATGFGGLALSAIGQSAELRRAATRLDELLTMARAEALRDGVATTVRFDAHAKQIALPSQGKVYVLPRSVAFTIAGTRTRGDSERPAIHFLGDGASSGGIIELLSGSRKVVRRVAWLTGRIDKGASE